jgi:hypothetical protein
VQRPFSELFNVAASRPAKSPRIKRIFYASPAPQSTGLKSRVPRTVSTLAAAACISQPSSLSRRSGP